MNKLWCTLRTLLGRPAVAGLVVLGLSAMAIVATTPPATAQDRHPMLTWHGCPNYSDEALRALRYDDGQIPEFRRLWARTECGTVSVPLDYDKPGGRQITIEVTRLRAVDQTRRLGSLAVNPGGPGGSGYLMPIDVVMHNPTDALNDRYDLIGFDPRGVGYSTKVNCPPSQGSGTRTFGPITEAVARQAYDDEVRNNQACSSYDPAFLRELTTANVARDLDQVRAALRQRSISFLGVSWGTWLGAVYRSLFPGKVDRMWLDSTAIPNPRLDAFEQGRAEAAAMDFSRMATWIAKYNERYGFGTTGTQVEAALAQLEQSYDANPRTFTDLDQPLDGRIIGMFSADPSLGWPFDAQVLKELRDATGPTAPPTVKEAFGGGGPRPTPPPGTPERLNRTMNQAVFCNEDTGPRDFDSAWAAYQQRLADFPVTGRISGFTPGCAGWTLPAQPARLRHNGGSLVMSAHRYESPSPYQWTIQMQAAIGGTVFTVNDDMHGSVLKEPECAAKLVTYFDTGTPGTHGCEGVPVPEPMPSARQLSTTAAPLTAAVHAWRPGDGLLGSD
jgi:pimeloyl-ACP methyl ester carboxylesterase